MTEREELINIIKSCNNPKYNLWPQAVVYPDMVADELIKAGYVKTPLVHIYKDTTEAEDSIKEA